MSVLESVVADLIIKATSAAEAAGKFAMEQLPDIAQQYVTYIAIYSGVCLLLGLIILIGCPFIGWRMTKDSDGYSAPPDWFGLIMGGVIGTVIGGIIIAANLSKFILAVWAPKILLIQWAAELVK